MRSPGPSRIVLKGVAPPPDGKRITVDADGHSVVVFNVRGALFAIDGQCTHVGGPLEEGELSGTRVECPWHGSVFDIETGRVLRGPAVGPVAAYRAFVDKEDLVLEPRPLDSGVPSGH
jgi:nitrite reductase/ring-hydroxylating ferredoxin subunit